MGSAFDDDLTGDDKDNVFVGGKGADTISGGAGNDTASYAASEVGVTINLADSSQNAGDRSTSRGL